MAQKVYELKNRGMLRDLSISKSSNEYAYENRNIRLTPLDKDTLLSVNNERGPKKVENIVLTGTALGHCVLNQYLIVFTTDNDFDRIYKLELKEDNTWSDTLLYEGDLNFSVEHPIETLGLYESENLQKVYWVDGINQPRVMRINETYTYDGNGTDTQFDFVTTFNPDIDIDIERTFDGAGMFPAGVIQYYVTYFNKYGQETNIVWQSPQYYLSEDDRGASPEESVNCSFNIKISDVDTSFDYIRVYSLIRTSYNTTPQLYIVGDLSITDELQDAVAILTDNGTYSESLDPTVLLYIGGIEISAYTLTQKDNTLFLGNIENKTEVYDAELDALIKSFRESADRSNYLRFIRTDNTLSEYSIPYYPNNNYYPYVSQLNASSDRIKTFKGGETYRIGIKFYTFTGSATSVYWLGDIFNPIYPVLNGIVYDRAVVYFEFPQDIKNYINSRYSQFQLFMAEATESDRCVIAQGVLSPTVFNIRQRCDNAPFSLSSWFFRFRNGNLESDHYEQLPPMADEVERDESGKVTSFKTSQRRTSVEIQGICGQTPVYVDTDSVDNEAPFYSYEITISAQMWMKWPNNGGYFHIAGVGRDVDGNDVYGFDIATPTDWINANKETEAVNALMQSLSVVYIPESAVPSRDDLIHLWREADNRANKGQYNWNHRKIVYISQSGGYTENKSEAQVYAGNSALTPSSARNAFIQENGNNHYVDESILTFHSPDITDESSDIEGYHLRIIGYTPVTSNISNFDINATPPENGVKTLYNKNFNSKDEITGICSYPLWQDKGQSSQTLYWMYPWHKTGSISRMEKMDNSDPDNPVGTGEYYSILEDKTWANLYYCYDTVFKVSNPTSSDDIGWKNLTDTSDVPADNIRFIKGELNSTYMIEQNSTVYNYQADEDYILSFDSKHSYPIINTGGENASSLEDRILNNNYFYHSCNDSVNIAFRSSAHAVVTFNDITKNSISYRSILPSVGTKDVTETLEGDLPWEELTGEGYDYYNLMTYQSDYPQFQVTSLGENSYQILNDSPEDWEKLVEPLISSGQGVYFSYIDSSGDTKVLKIISLSIEKPKLATPQFTVNIEETNLKIVISSVVNASEYKVTVSSTDEGQIYDTTSPDLTRTVALDGSSSYTISVQAIDGEDYDPSDVNTKVFSEHDITINPDTITLDWNDTSDHTVTVNASENWNISESVTTYGADLLADTLMIQVTATDITNTLTEPCYFNDIRYGRRWEWDPDNTTIISPKSGSSRYISTALGWNIDTQYEDNPYLLVGELYRDYDENSAYGGNTEYALRNNTFIPISRRYSIASGNIFYGSEGDTFFQRWDCLKTEPYAEGKENSIVEMLSFMVETHRNLDGRYDVRRGMMNNLNTDSSNINFINEVYSQPDNFTTGVVFSGDEELSMFPTQITWTKTKTLNEDIDTWTNITLSSVLDMDGDKGEVTALRRFSNSIIAFQERGISEILFNTRTQLATTEGIPIEIANSGKVDGKRYISEKVGCINKWSIVEASTGIYFIDNVNSSISIFNGSIQSLSNVKGFKAWMQQNNNTSIWNPAEFNNFISFYDRANDDIYFINGNDALCFNEMLNEFSSFYSYEETPIMATVQDKFIGVKNNSLWEMHEGDYNNFYGVLQPFSITYKVNPDPYGDKTFTNIEYKADVFLDDVFQPEITFNELDVWNEYQRGHLDLDFKSPGLSNLKRKFRNWAAFIPRDNVNNPYGYNRIRNPWIYLKLTMNENLDNTRMEFHNVLVRYI